MAMEMGASVSIFSEMVPKRGGRRVGPGERKGRFHQLAAVVEASDAVAAVTGR